MSASRGEAALYSSQSGVPSEPAFGLLGWKPVKAGLCEHPEDWRWSSFRHYALQEKGVVEIESEWTARDRERQATGSAEKTFLIPG